MSSIGMRDLNAQERKTVQTLLNRASQSSNGKSIQFNAIDCPCKVTYLQSGAFTIAVVMLTGSRGLVGIAKRNPSDKPNLSKGMALAFYRALTSRVEQIG